MSTKELSRLEVMQKLEDKRMSQKEAAEVLRVSVRHVKRLLKAYRRSGAKGLISKQRGQPSNDRLPEETRQKALELLTRKYTGFRPTLAHEKLVELDSLKVSDESVRQLMIVEGLWQAKKARKVVVHPMRERRACFGELIQMDGSPHDWFEGRAPACTLLVFMVALSATIIDDASGRLTQLLFVESESFFSYCRAAEGYFTRYGKPAAFYRVGLRQRQTWYLPGQPALHRYFGRPDAVRTGDAGTGYPDHLCQHASGQRPRRAGHPDPPGPLAQGTALARHLYPGANSMPLCQALNLGAGEHSGNSFGEKILAAFSFRGTLPALPCLLLDMIGYDAHRPLSRPAGQRKPARPSHPGCAVVRLLPCRRPLVAGRGGAGCAIRPTLAGAHRPRQRRDPEGGFAALWLRGSARQRARLRRRGGSLSPRPPWRVCARNAAVLPRRSS
ncbi:MAG: hypothetical protein C0411_17090 [Pseudomonas sp.]|nr:hypothetical protein [Pseudomonas sp.]